MPSMALLTPSYRGDLAAFVQLHESVLRHTPESVIHHVVVPAEDESLFADVAGERVVLHSTSEFVPAGYRSVYRWTRHASCFPGARRVARIQALNPRRPWPPLRGWVVQQLVKLGATAIEADVVVSIDSDAILVRRLAVEQFFAPDGRPLVFRSPAAVTEDMHDHLRWLETAGRLLGLAPPTLPCDDYITPFVAWHRPILQQLHARLREVTDAGEWHSHLAKLHTLSECMLYGRFVTECWPQTAVAYTHSRSCLTYWPERPMKVDEIPEFLGHLRGDALAIVVQSASGTPPAVARMVATMAEERLRNLQPD